MTTSELMQRARTDISDSLMDYIDGSITGNEGQFWADAEATFTKLCILLVRDEADRGRPGMLREAFDHLCPRRNS